MGAFLSLMSGLAKGAGDQQAQIAEEQRKNKMRQNELMASALEKDLSDPKHTRESHEAVSRQLYTLRGVPKKMQDQLINAHNSLWDQFESANQAKGGAPGTAPSPTSVASGNAPDPTQPQSPAQGQLAPPMPTRTQIPTVGPNVTQGDIDAARTQSSLRATTDIQEQSRAKLEASKQQSVLQRQLDLMKAAQASADEMNGAGGHHYMEVGPNGPSLKTKSARYGGLVQGHQIQEDTVNGRPGAAKIQKDPNTWYRRLHYDGIGRDEYEIQGNVGKVERIQDPNDPTKAINRVFDRGGRVIEDVPDQQAFVSSTVPKETTSTTQVFDPSTGRQVPKTTNTLTRPASSGQAPPSQQGPFPPMPQAPSAITGASGGTTPVTPPASRPVTSKPKKTATPRSAIPTNDNGGFAPEQVTSIADKIQSDDKNWKLTAGNKRLNNAVVQELAKRTTGITKIDSNVRDSAARASAVIPEIDKLQDDITALDKQGKLGVFASRMNDFVAGKVGSGDPDFEKLRLSTSLAKSALGMIHGGARGGGSVQMVERFDKLLNSGTMDAPTLKAGLQEMNVWLRGYRNLDPARQPQFPQGNGKELDRQTAMTFYREAGRSPEAARALATQNGWVTKAQ